MPVGSHLPSPTVLSLVETVRLCTEHRFKVRQVSPVGCSIVTDARSGVVDEFLRGDSTHLFWLDSDMHWRPTDFLRLLALCTQVDVVGATYSPKVEPIRFMVRSIKPTPNQYGLFDVGGLGLGFVCMRRAVVEAVAATKPMIQTNGMKHPIREVFRLDKMPSGHRLGEDMAFFQDIKDAGYTVWMDPTVNVNHVGLKLYGGNVMAAVEKGALDGTS